MATTPRVYKSILSKYQRTRIAGPRFVRGERFTLSINANGALDDGEIINIATWYTYNNVGIIFGQAATEDRQAHIQCLAGWGPGTWVKVDLTTSLGRVFTQLWQVIILSAPYFQDETFPSPGPASVTSTNGDIIELEDDGFIALEGS